MKLNFRFFSFTLFLLLTVGLSSLSQNVTFNYVAPPPVNAWNIVVSITQDHQGYMWFAGNGIHKYDGNKVTTYLNDPLNPNSLATNFPECIYGDPDGLIWIGSMSKGLDRFDPAKNTFTHFRHQPGNAASLGNDSVTSVKMDHNGILWIGTQAGLDRYDPKTNTFTHYSHNDNDPASISNNHVRIVYIDRKGEIWAGTGSPFYDDNVVKGEGGLNHLDTKTGKFTRYMHSDTDSNSLVDNRIRAIYEDNAGTFWVGSAGDGLHTLDRVTGKFTRYPYDPLHPERLSRPPLKKTLPYVDDHITFITGDVTGQLWIGTMMGGINVYDPKTGKVTGYGTGVDFTGAPKEIQAWAANISQDGMLWISTWQAALFRIDPYHKSFPYHSIGEEVHAISKEATGVDWIATNNAIIKVDEAKGIRKKFIAANGRLDIHDQLKGINGKLWITTNTEGLFSFDPQTEKFTRHNLFDANTSEQKDKATFTLYKEDEHNLWISSIDGLYKMDLRTEKVIAHYSSDPKDSNTLSNNYIFGILTDTRKRFWAASTSGTGLNLLLPGSTKFKHYLKGNSLHHVFEDAAGVIWTGGTEGLFHYNDSTDSFTNFVNPSSGLAFKNVFGIGEDNHNRLWIFTTFGSYQFNQRHDSSKAFALEFGLRNITYSGIIRNGKKGLLFLSNPTGYFEIDPDELTGNFSPPQIAVTDFRLGEQSIFPGDGSPLKDAISRAKEINLNYRQNVFSLDFDVLHFSDPKNNQAIYKLENYDDKWRQSGSEHSASYYNVPPGKYVFHIKAASSNGVWREKQITIVVSPPWWRTWWAYTLFALLIIFSIWGFIYYRSAKLRSENLVLEEKVKHRTTQLQQSLESLKATQSQLIQAEKMASLGELTAGIAHEIQNPLNFVNNFSEVNRELVDELKAELAIGNQQLAIDIANDIKDNSEKINHHGKRADAIVKGMLQHSQSGTGKKEPTDINKLADEYLRLAYHGLKAKDKSFNVKMQTDFDKSIGLINIIPQDIGRVLLNLYNNAFYAAKPATTLPASKGELGSFIKHDSVVPEVIVTTKRLDSPLGVGGVIITVRDNGAGIPQNIIDKIFQPFFTTKPTGQGTGLGLSLSYDIVKAHGGEIKVVSKEGEFSEFTVVLPGG